MVFSWHVRNFDLPCDTARLAYKIRPCVNVCSTITWTSSGVKVYLSYTSGTIDIFLAIFVATCSRSERKQRLTSATLVCLNMRSKCFGGVSPCHQKQTNKQTHKYQICQMGKCLTGIQTVRLICLIFLARIVIHEKKKTKCGETFHWDCASLRSGEASRTLQPEKWI